MYSYNFNLQITNASVEEESYSNLNVFYFQTGNILIIRSITMYKHLQTPTNFFLASLAVTDFLLILFLPIQIVSWRTFFFC